MVLASHRRTEQRQQFVAAPLQLRAAEAGHGLGHDPVGGFEIGLAGLGALGHDQLGRIAQIGQQHGQLLQLALCVEQGAAM